MTLGPVLLGVSGRVVSFSSICSIIDPGAFALLKRLVFCKFFAPLLAKGDFAGDFFGLGGGPEGGSAGESTKTTDNEEVEDDGEERGGEEGGGGGGGACPVPPVTPRVGSPVVGSVLTPGGGARGWSRHNPNGSLVLVGLESRLGRTPAGSKGPVPNGPPGLPLPVVPKPRLRASGDEKGLVPSHGPHGTNGPLVPVVVRPRLGSAGADEVPVPNGPAGLLASDGGKPRL